MSISTYCLVTSDFNKIDKLCSYDEVVLLQYNETDRVYFADHLDGRLLASSSYFHLLAINVAKKRLILFSSFQGDFLLL